MRTYAAVRVAIRWALVAALIVVAAAGWWTLWGWAAHTTGVCFVSLTIKGPCFVPPWHIRHCIGQFIGFFAFGMTIGPCWEAWQKLFLKCIDAEEGKLVERHKRHLLDSGFRVRMVTADHCDRAACFDEAGCQCLCSECVAAKAK